MGTLTEVIRKWLRGQRVWVRFRELNREGWSTAFRRRLYQRQILGTPPVRTMAGGPVEVRVLTWRRDWINLIWSLKSFYHYSEVDYPLFIHDGGLEAHQIRILAQHFPDAKLVTRSQADEQVDTELRRQGWHNCVRCRQSSVMARKFFDYYLGSTADRVISIDSDELFFKKPIELLEPDPHGRNLYNQDPETAYSLPYDQLCRLTGLNVPEKVNAGLSVVWRRSINLEHVDRWLAEPGILDSPWLVEQTLHALCGAEAGVRLLPSTYLSTTQPGLPPDAVAKHFPGFFRPLLYSEGMRTLIDSGFIRSLMDRSLAHPPPLTIPYRIRRRLAYYRDVVFWQQMIVERCLPAIMPLVYPPRNRRPPDPAAVKSVLVWNIDSFGDLLWTTPTLRALRAGYPSAKITMICNQSAMELLETNPHIGRLVPVKAARFYEGHGLFARINEIKDQAFDLMLILEMGSRPADAARLLSRRLNVGYSVSTEVGLLKKLADYTLPPNSPVAPEYWPAYFLRTIEHLGLPVPPATLEVFRTDEDRQAIAKWLRQVCSDGQNLPLIGFHPCVAPYANLTKKWPQEHYVDLAVLLLAKDRARIVLTGSAEERAECEALAEKIRAATGAQVIVTAGEFGPRRLIELLAAMKLVVVADTAILHFAAAAGTPTIGLFGATNLAMIAPRNANCIALSENLPCSPCLQNRDRIPFWPKCIFARQECMYSLSPSRVAMEAQRLLERAGESNPRISLSIAAYPDGI